MKPQLNSLDLWLPSYPVPEDTQYKYDRGHLLILAASDLVGATKLAASAATRIGAGVVTVLADTRADVLRTILPADVIVREGCVTSLPAFDVCLGGPGGITPEHELRLFEQLQGTPRVLDAGALPLERDWGKLCPKCVLTPHEGEFARVFPDVTGSREARVRKAAELTSAVVLLKGPQTLIAHPDGRIVVNDRPNPYLAKAGSGDVLAGFIGGLMAQGMPGFEAACAGAWFHSECGDRLGPGLVATDLDRAVPDILWEM